MHPEAAAQQFFDPGSNHVKTSMKKEHFIRIVRIFSPVGMHCGRNRGNLFIRHFRVLLNLKVSNCIV